jgi:hypothetical protein
VSEWREVASGDAGSVPDVALEAGRDYRVVVELPLAVPDWLAGGLAAAIWSAVGAVATVRDVRVSGSTVTVELGA